MSYSGYLTRQYSKLAQPETAKTRWQLFRVIREYQPFKYNEIFDPLIAAHRTEPAMTAKRFKAACIAAGEAYQARAIRWLEQGALGNWTKYQQAVLEIVEQVAEHLRSERMAGMALLSGVSRTRKE